MKITLVLQKRILWYFVLCLVLLFAVLFGAKVSHAQGPDAPYDPEEQPAWLLGTPASTSQGDNQTETPPANEPLTDYPTYHPATGDTVSVNTQLATARNVDPLHNSYRIRTCPTQELVCNTGQANETLGYFYWGSTKILDYSTCTYDEKQKYLWCHVYTDRNDLPYDLYDDPTTINFVEGWVSVAFSSKYGGFTYITRTPRGR